MLPNKSVLFWFSGLVCLAGLSGCADGLGDPTGSVCPTDSTLTYENFGQAFFEKNCLSCHESQESPHFTTQSQIQAYANDIDRAAASGPDGTNTYMPEDGDVAESDRKKLGEWLACGAP